MTPDTEPASLVDAIKWLVSALGAVALWILGMFKKRIEAQEMSHTQLLEKVRELELTTVGKDTFQRHEADTNDKLDAMRREAIGREDRIVNEIRGLGSRIDTLFQRHER